jgi:[NiFe] hydrogenase assembly HybE family chaperone
MSESGILRGDPCVRITDTYERIWRTRMEGLPFLNPRLRVEAVGFRAWEGQWLGALVTPWSLNLLLLPGEGEWTSLPAGSERFVDFPAGCFRFIAGHEATLGESHSCSLFSPVLEFTDHDVARLTAEAALVGLFDAALAPTDDHVLREREPGAEAIAGEADAAAVSKRDFLSGRFSGAPHGDRE